MNHDAKSSLHNGGLPEDAEGVEVTFKSLTETFQGSASFIISISAFGAALFSAIVSQIKDPQDISENPWFGVQTVRIFISLAWLSFVLCLTIVGFCISFLKILGKYEGAKMDPKIWQPVGIVVWGILYGLITLAFVFLSLVLVAYVGPVGWIALGFACLVGIMSVTCIVLESM